MSKDNCIFEIKQIAPVAVIFISATLVLGLAAYFIYLLDNAPMIKVSDYIQVLVLFVISLTLGLGVWVQRSKEKYEESHEFLNSSIDLINKAYDVLSKDGKPTTSRVSWVTAARLISRSIDIEKGISVYSHRKIFESEKDFQRHKFNNLLKEDGNDLPVAFFCGSDYKGDSIGETAYNGEKGKIGQNWIPIRIISVIYKFKSYPKDYEDPLEKSQYP